MLILPTLCFFNTYKFGRELFIEEEDFLKVPVPKFHRLYVGNKVRLKGAYVIECTGFDEDENGNVTTIYATYDPATKSGSDCTVKVKGTIHWLNQKHAKQVEVRLFENLTLGRERDENGEYTFNPNSLTILENAYVEDGITYTAEERYQFIRNGYYCLDSDTTPDKLVFNRTVTLKDSKHK